MRHIAGTIGGFCSGFLIYMMASMLFLDLTSKDVKTPGLVFVLVFFVGGWIISHAAIVQSTKGFAKPMARAFLIGSCEWLMMVLVGLIYSGKIASSVGPSTGAALGGGLIAIFTGGISIGMALFCAIGFFLFHFMGREGASAMAADQEMKRCPDCAELIIAQARKCKHCGYQFVESPPTSEAG